MARARNIKPGFFKNEDLAECSPWARLCFAGLWTLADREGRLEDRPKRIKGELFAFDSVEVEPLLRDLEARGFILRYVVDGRALMQIVAFLKHQTPHHREPESDLPPPQSPGQPPDGTTPKPRAEDASNDDKAQGKPKAEEARNDLASGSGRVSRAGALDSGLLIPDSGYQSSPKPRRVVHDFPPGFETFWSAYPRKDAKADAAKAFTRLRPDEALLRSMLSAIAWQRDSEQWRKDRQFIPLPATWLNGRRWLDESPGKTADDPFAGNL